MKAAVTGTSFTMLALRTRFLSGSSVFAVPLTTFLLAELLGLAWTLPDHSPAALT